MGSRGGEYEREALILSRALVILKVNWPEGPREGGLGHWFLSGHPERNSPPQRRNPLRHKRYFKSSPSASPNFIPARNPCTA